MLPASRRGFGKISILVGAGYAATMICFVLANKMTTAANTIFLQSSAPIYLVLIGPLFLKEPIRRREIVFMGVLFLGLVLFFVGTEAPVATAPRPFAGNMIALASGVFWAITVASLRYMGRDGGRAGGAAASVVAGNVIASLVALPFALPITDVRPADLAVVSFLGVIQIGLAYVFLTYGLAHVGALAASLLLLAEPVLNPLWAWLVHGERPSAWSMAGGLVIVAATLAKSVYDARRPEPEALA
jgi:drug/metabolite transporter (DMT)-like permease